MEQTTDQHGCNIKVPDEGYDQERLSMEHTTGLDECISKKQNELNQHGWIPMKKMSDKTGCLPWNQTKNLIPRAFEWKK